MVHPEADIAADCTVVELRQYRLHPGMRETLVALFEREFIEPQEAGGMRVLGQFRDLDRPDHFVWLRGFAGMAVRRRALESFYGGAVWGAHRDAANATMVDSDDVLLLRPAWPGSGLRVRPRAPDAPAAAGLLDATVFPLRAPAAPELLDRVRGAVTRVLLDAGALALGWYVSETAVNDFPRLPVREGAQVLVGFALFPDGASFDAFVASGRWSREAAPLLHPYLAGPAQSLRLQPTARSAVRA